MEDNKKNTVREIYNLDWDDMTDEELELAEEMGRLMFYCSTGKNTCL